MNKSKLLMLMAGCVLISSCANPAGKTRKSEPHFLFTVQGDINEIAACVLHRLEDKKPILSYEYRNLTPEFKEIKGARSTYNLTGYGAEFFNILVSFRQNGQNINVVIQETTSRPSDIAEEARAATLECAK